MKHLWSSIFLRHAGSLVAACELLAARTRDLVPGKEPEPPAWEAWSLRHRTTREIPQSLIVSIGYRIHTFVKTHWTVCFRSVRWLILCHWKEPRILLEMADSCQLRRVWDGPGTPSLPEDGEALKAWRGRGLRMRRRDTRVGFLTALCFGCRTSFLVGTTRRSVRLASHSWTAQEERRNLSAGLTLSFVGLFLSLGPAARQVGSNPPPLGVDVLSLNHWPLGKSLGFRIL